MKKESKAAFRTRLGKRLAELDDQLSDINEKKENCLSLRQDAIMNDLAFDLFDNSNYWYFLSDKVILGVKSDKKLIELKQTALTIEHELQTVKRELINLGY